MSESVAAAKSCGVDGCIHHPQHWSQSDIEDGNRPLPEAGFSDFPVIIARTPPIAITKDEEEAMGAAEVLEVLSEAHHFEWNAGNTAS